MPPEVFLSAVSPQGLRLLLAYHRREGFVADRIEGAVARLCALTVNMQRKKGAAPVEPSVFLPHHRAWDEVEALLDPVEYERRMMREQFGRAGLRVRQVERPEK